MTPLSIRHRQTYDKTSDLRVPTVTSYLSTNGFTINTRFIRTDMERPVANKHKVTLKNSNCPAVLVRMQKRV